MASDASLAVHALKPRNIAILRLDLDRNSSPRVPRAPGNFPLSTRWPLFDRKNLAMTKKWLIFFVIFSSCFGASAPSGPNAHYAFGACAGGCDFRRCTHREHAADLGDCTAHWWPGLYGAAATDGASAESDLEPQRRWCAAPAFDPYASSGLSNQPILGGVQGMPPNAAPAACLHESGNRPGLWRESLRCQSICRPRHGLRQSLPLRRTALRFSRSQLGLDVALATAAAIHHQLAT